uniref:Uncharacterized protein n=1 Tax=Myotis myotis TaxID=51298 RepID=A0A7J7QVI6_MYOMY|nr:hypothetical protein mMyoMyo1_011541 [Myotis myotis]
MREKHRPAASCSPPAGDVPATKVHALDRNRTRDPSVRRPTLYPLSHTGQGLIAILIFLKKNPFAGCKGSPGFSLCVGATWWRMAVEAACQVALLKVKRGQMVLTWVWAGGMLWAEWPPGLPLGRNMVLVPVAFGSWGSLIEETPP